MFQETWFWPQTQNGLHFFIGNHKGAYGVYSRIEGIRPNPQYDTEGAVKILRKALAEDPNQPELLHDLTFMLYKLGEFQSVEEAEKNFILNPHGNPILAE